MGSNKQDGRGEQDEVLTLVADEYAKEILIHLSEERLSAAELDEVCRAAESTVYDRLTRLEDVGLVTEHLHVDPNGHHRHVYGIRVDAVRVEIRDGEYDVRLQVREDAADRIAQMWQTVRGERE